MSEDASLDEFVDAGDGSDSTTDGTGGGDGGETADSAGERQANSDEAAGHHDDGEEISDEAAADGTADAEPARSTAAWSEEPGDCADCGTAVRRRWRDGDELVCGDCKEW